MKGDGPVERPIDSPEGRSAGEGPTSSLVRLEPSWVVGASVSPFHEDTFMVIFFYNPMISESLIVYNLRIEIVL